MGKRLNRSHRCELTGKRALLLNEQQAAAAWRNLSARLIDELGHVFSRPKFKDLLSAIRRSTIHGKKPL